MAKQKKKAKKAKKVVKKKVPKKKYDPFVTLSVRASTKRRIDALKKRMIKQLKRDVSYDYIIRQLLKKK